jgi:cysteine synthase B
LPLQRIGFHLPPSIRLYAKAEWFNPGGSVKDRPALNIIRSALTEGSLQPGKHLLDSTSGNMGIAYATFCASMGIPLTLTIPSNASPERIAILKALGAELILTDPLEGSDGAMEIARQIAYETPERYFYANQYDNPANWEAHYHSTGPEIIQQTDSRVTHFVAGLGTSGTMTGVSRYLRQYNPEIQNIAVQPDSPLHGLEGLKHMSTSVKPRIYDPTIPDRTIAVNTESAYEMTRRLAREEGLFVGISAGAAAVGALHLAERIQEGVIVMVFPDAGYKYLSESTLWRD